MKILSVALLGSAGLAVSLLAPSPAQAQLAPACSDYVSGPAYESCTIVNPLDNKTYVISRTSFQAFVDAFPTPSTTDMFWWEDDSAARVAAERVGSALGFPFGGGTRGPFFAYELNFNPNQNTDVNFYNWSITGSLGAGSTQSQTNGLVWAKSTLASPTSVPGPLPALGAATAFGFSRKLRQRIKRSSNTVSGPYGA